MTQIQQQAEAPSDFVVFWNEVLATKFNKYQNILMDGLSYHSQVPMNELSLASGSRALDVGCGWGDTAIQLASKVGENGEVPGMDCVDIFMEYGRFVAEIDFTNQEVLDLKDVTNDCERRDMVAVLGYSKEEIRQAVRDMYTMVATKPTTPLHFPVGRDACLLAGYSEQQISDLPTSSLESFAGAGCPFRAEVIQQGDVVLDIGSGSGADVMLASKMVGESGKVIALDLTPAMRRKLQQTLDSHEVSNVEILSGDAESIPLPNESVDVVTSNGVLNSGN